jgi:hypothetical protein
MTREIISGILGGTTVTNEVAFTLIYRQFLKLAVSLIDYTEMVIESLEEHEDESHQPVIQAP